MSERAFVLRKATPEHAFALAELLDVAGEGLPRHLWAQRAALGEDPIAVGARRAAGTEGGFSHIHAYVALVSGEIAGMLLGYPLPDPHEVDLEDAPPEVRPLLELEAQVPGSWYVNAVAAVPECRGSGVGTFLMKAAESLARQAESTSISLIVAEDNAGAVRLYRRLGYEAVARRRVVPFPGCAAGGDWVLMRRGLA